MDSPKPPALRHMSFKPSFPPSPPRRRAGILSMRLITWIVDYSGEDEGQI